MESCYVYGLRFQKLGHHFHGLIRYVGKSLSPRRRFFGHARGDGGTYKLSRSVKKHGIGCFDLEVLATYVGVSKEEAEAAAYAGEREHIAQLNTLHGAHGLNATSGGGSVYPVLTQEGVRRHKVALRALHLRPGFREKRLAASRSGRQTIEAKRKHLEALARRVADPVQRARMVEIGSSLGRSPVFQERARAALRDRFARDAEFRERHIQRLRALHQNPEIQSAQEAARKRIINDPVVRAKRAASCKAWAEANREKILLLVAQREANPIASVRRRLGIAKRWHKYALANDRLDVAKRHATTIASCEAELDALLKRQKARGACQVQLSMKSD